MKRLKPGQLATINGHVYRCSKAEISACYNCMFFDQCRFGHSPIKIQNCVEIFGEYRPILVK